MVEHRQAKRLTEAAPLARPDMLLTDDTEPQDVRRVESRNRGGPLNPNTTPERIRKLLNLARDQAGTPEGETAARLARRAMRESAWDRARRGVSRAKLPLHERVLDLEHRWPWRRRLVAAVARHCACVAAWPPSGSQVLLFGTVSNLDIAAYLAHVLLRELDGARAAWLAAQPDYDPDGPSGPELSQRTTGFCNSAVAAVEAKLRAMRHEELSIDPEGHAMVLSEGDDVQRWLEERGISLKPSSPNPHRFVAEGWTAGHGIALHDAMQQTGANTGRLARQK